MADVAPGSADLQIGTVLRDVREAQGLSLRTLATRAGISPSFLSQLEHGRVSPSLGSLERLARELATTTADLYGELEDGRRPVVVRAAMRPRLPARWSRTSTAPLTPHGDRRRLKAVALTLAPHAFSGTCPAAPSAVTFTYVLDGTVTLHVTKDAISLGAGDAVIIPPHADHRWENTSSAEAHVLLVSTRLLM